MAFRTDSDWSLNKKTSDLVYSFSDGSSKVYRKIDNQIFEIVTTEKDGKSMRLVSDEEMTALLRKHCDLTPGGIIRKLQLRRPIYSPTARNGHFGVENLPWEQTDLADVLRLAL